MNRACNPVISSRARRWLPPLFIAAISLGMLPLQAATCGLTVQSLNFGDYDFQTNQDLDSVGHVTVSCDAGTPFTIALSPGGGTFAERNMQNGVHRLAYNLYTDATRTMVWGDGSGGSTVVSDNGTQVDRSVYGRVPAGQKPYIGIYSDTITVTLSF
jgi:spore coat protein U-like protein